MNSILNYPPHHLTWWDRKGLDKLLTRSGLEPFACLAEPLRRVNFSMGLFAWMCPRRDSHFDFSLQTRALQKICAVLGRLVPGGVTEVPFVIGHTMLTVARKPD